MRNTSRVGAQHAAPAKIEYPVGARYIVPEINTRNSIGANRIRPINIPSRSGAPRLLTIDSL
jgi:hypothetical protein